MNQNKIMGLILDLSLVKIPISRAGELKEGSQNLKVRKYRLTIEGGWVTQNQILIQIWGNI